METNNIITPKYNKASSYRTYEEWKQRQYLPGKQA